MKEQIKLLLGIKDSLQDAVLDVIIKNVTAHLRSLLKKPVPSELDFIIVEISVRRFQRLGSEGMKSESVEGHNISFYDLKDEFVPYLDIINDHREDGDSKGKKGRVCMI